MATLTEDEKVKVRNALEEAANAAGIPITWIKQAANAGAQAIEDLLVSNAGTISNVINTATAPFGVTFTGAQKKILVAYTLLQKFERDK